MTPSPDSTPPPRAAHCLVPPQSLICHPATPGGFSLSITASVEYIHDQPEDGWRIRYELRGDLAELFIPEPTTPGSAEGLWQHTCFEAFVAERGVAAYQEFNFSPSSQWASYLFSAERVRDTAAESAVPSLDSQTPSVAWYRMSDAFVLEASIPESAFRFKRSGQSLDLGLTAVIETRDHRLTYWALQHPFAKPDFHNRQGFALQVTVNMRE